MAKGVVYLMRTAVDGIIKIGKTETKNFETRMRTLEFNGYANVSGLKRFFAIEVEDYSEKEKMLHDIFATQQVGSTELFTAEADKLQQLLLAFEGKVIFPANTNQEKVFEEVARARTQGQQFSFYLKGISDGSEITFIKDPSIVATVCGEREVLFEGQAWKLSPLTYRIYEMRNELTSSGAYQGAYYWSYGGKRLSTIANLGN